MTDFTDYQVEDFIMDDSFQDYCLELNQHHTSFWELWITENPSKQEEFEEAKALLKEILIHETASAQEGNYLFIRNKLQAYINSSLSQKIKFVHRIHQPVWWRNWAAAIVLVLLASIIFLWNRGQTEVIAEVTPPVEYIVKETLTGQRSTINLSDGTVIKLNSESRLRIPKNYSAHQREVYLEGEAFFEVAKDSLHPFRILSGKVETKVLGTSFNIRAYPEASQIQVAVVTGKVQVSNTKGSGQAALMLTPNEMAVFSKGDHLFSKTGFDNRKVTSWKDDIIYFYKDDLSKVVTKLERWYGVEVEVYNNANTRNLFKGSFQEESLENVLMGLSEIVPFDYQFREGKVFIKLH
ncbi:FecR domain-containing protein [Rapidithrix thailandica]|uniref:FecR domain-containing protein n=1 Tax=Rapidithrix thailandica TaxID=413964 RepID=A0AAW9SET1_9BACT